MQKALTEDFEARNNWFTNRSSAVFPVRLRRGGDLTFCFLNYWRLKNAIVNVQCNIRLFDSDGILRKRHCLRVVEDHYEISTRAILDIEEFDGMAEIEFVSIDNLRFPFPAVQGIYSADNRFSSVHSAGRIKNPDEAEVFQKINIETNWNCKFADDVTPFFHVFNGPFPTPYDDIEVAIYSPENEIISRIRYTGLPARSFASRFVTMEDLHGCNERFPDGSFCKVRLSVHGIFPRLVVGNLHKSINFIEATHSFSQVDISDFVPVAEKSEIKSFIPAPQPQGLSLRLLSFPTNSSSLVNARLRAMSGSQVQLSDIASELTWRTGEDAGEKLSYELDKDARLVSLDFLTGAIPSRLNVSYCYSVPGSVQDFSTDIATGAKAWIYPPKHSHWGASVLGDGYETILMIRNMSHSPDLTATAEGSITCWMPDGSSVTQSLSVSAESVEFVELSRLALSKQRGFVHWLVNFNVPSIEIFWLSHTKDGRICGDHAF